MATEDWIQESIARLESLEEERKRHEEKLETASDPNELRMHTQAIERLDVKIQALVAELEAVADEAGASTADGEAADSREEIAAASDESDAETRVFRPEDVKPAPVAAAAPIAARPTPSPAAPAASPFGGPAASPPAAPFGGPAAPPSPFGDAPMAASPFGSSSGEGPSFSSSAGASFDGDDEGGGGSKTGLIIGLVVLLVGGGAAAFFLLGKKPVEAPVEAPVEVKVLKAGEVPPDTQGPRTAKGADITSTQGSQIKESDRRPSGGGGGGSSASSTPTDAPKKKKDDKKTKIEQTDDPLAGIR